jgi:arsenite-transporting ATPase
VGYAKRLAGQLLDASALRARFMDRWGEVIRTILDRGTYLDDADIAPLVETALPGSDEIFSALALAELLAERSSGLSAAGRTSQTSKPKAQSLKPTAHSPEPTAYTRVFVDTAPTGHTLRLLNLPRTFRALVRLLEAMQAKHRFMVKTLTRAYRADDADAFLAEMHRLVSALEETLHDPARCVAIMVAHPQRLVLEETRRYMDALRDLRIHVAAVVWNAVDDGIEPLGSAAQYHVARLDRWPTGKKGLEEWLDSLKVWSRESKAPARQVARRQRSPKRSAARRAPVREPRVLLRPLTIVAGKGGVGKTTVASALALVAGHTQRTLLVSTDPAPSLADALAQPIPDADTQVIGEDAGNLFARQMDASAAFANLRAEYESRVDALFDALVMRGVDMAHDRAIARDLLALAPPGVDEVYALSLLSEALFKSNYECVVVDPAPTGHLLRLLEMPQLALAWSHQLLRLMLKYKDITGLGDTAREVLDFARSLRTVDALLRDTARSALVLVTLDEPVVIEETERLAREVAARGVGVSGVVLNRAASTPRAALPVAEAPVHFQAPTVSPPPIGVDALRRWADAWTEA